MTDTVRSVEYYYVIVEDKPGEAYAFLKTLEGAEVNILAFNVIPLGMGKTEMVLFPEDTERMAKVAEQVGVMLRGPHRAFLIQGDDELGALVDLHRKLADAKVNVLSSNGITDGHSGFGYVVYVRNDDFDVAAAVLGA